MGSWQADLSITRDAVDHEKISVGTSAAVGLTSTKVQTSTGRKRTYAVVTVESTSGYVRFWPDGTDPTSTDGHRIDSGQEVELVGGNNLANARFIAVTAAATLQVSYSE